MIFHDVEVEQIFYVLTGPLTIMSVLEPTDLSAR